MRHFGIEGVKPLESRIRLYWEGGEGALRPKLKGGQRGARTPRAHEEGLEREVRRLEEHVAYLKNRQP